MIKLATLFSGIGAIEQTLKKMNIEHNIVFACDNGERSINIPDEIKIKIDKTKNPIQKKELVDSLYKNCREENYMEKSYKANYLINENDFHQDIRFLDGKIYFHQVDLLVGGSPCQSFSVNGKRGGFLDTRGTLFYEYARIIKEAQPKCFIFENVKGMLTHDNGKTWEIIKNTFKELNYNIFIHKDEIGKESPILNAKDYDFPQNRPRLYVVGFRQDLKNIEAFEFPESIKLTKCVQDYLEKSVESKYYLSEKGFNFVTTHPSRAQVNCPIMRCQKANQQFNWNGDFIFEEINKVKDNIEIMKKAFVSKWNGSTGVCRKFTPRECLRLMGFSDDFKIVVNDQMMYRQAGNSIVVDVLEKILNKIIETGVFDND